MKIDSLIRGTAAAFILRALGAALTLLLNIAIGRLLGASGAGLYFLAMSVVSIAAVVARLGLENTVLRFVASHVDAGDWGRAKGTLRHALSWVGVVSAGCAGAIMIAAPWIAEGIFDTPDLTPVLIAIALSVLSFNVMTILGEALKGLSRVRDAMLVLGVLYPAGALAVIYPAAGALGANGAALAYVGGTCLAAVVGGVFWRRATVGTAPAAPIDTAQIRASSRPLWVSMIAIRAILPWVPLFLLGIWGTTDEVGVFGAALRIALLIIFLLLAVNTVVSPRIAAHHAKGEVADIATLARRIALLATVAASPALLVFIFAGDVVMGLFGPEFRAGGTVLAILALGQVVNAATGPVGVILMMGGREKQMRNVTLLSVVVVVTLSVILIPTMTATGAAIATATGYAVTGILGLILVRLEFGIWAMPFFPAGPRA